MSEDSTRNLSQDALSQILARLDSIDSRLTSLDARLTTLEDKVDRRLQETRPIWEQVLLRLDSLEGEMSGLREETRAGFRRFERQVGMLAEDMLKVRADQRDLDERLSQLEPKPTQ